MASTLSKLLYLLFKGPDPLIVPESKGSYQERLKYAFEKLDREKSVLIIINYKGMSTTNQEIQKARLNTRFMQLSTKKDQLSTNLLVGIEAVIANR